MGWVGKFFGSAAEAPSNVAGIAFIASFIGLMVLFFVDLPADAPRSEGIGVFGTMMTLSVGYLFGKKGN